jgi:hypothetical protein
MRRSRPLISYDRARGEATFEGPGGFTQQQMTENVARAIAVALGVPFNPHDGHAA